MTRSTVRNMDATNPKAGQRHLLKMRLGSIAFALLVSAGGCTYTPGTFAHGMTVFPKERATVGCLDLAVERREDKDGWPVLAYRFGNRCDRPAMVDLRGAVVMGRMLDGKEIQLLPFDPKVEIKPMQIDARLAGGEVIAYSTMYELQQVCVDAATIAQVSGERWMCFASAAPPQDRPEDSLPPSEVAESGEVL